MHADLVCLAFFIGGGKAWWLGRFRSWYRSWKFGGCFGRAHEAVDTGAAHSVLLDKTAAAVLTSLLADITLAKCAIPLDI
jgi:hypothetical protein